MLFSRRVLVVGLAASVILGLGGCMAEPREPLEVPSSSAAIPVPTTSSAAPTATPTPTPTPTPAPTNDYDIDAADSLTVIVNKLRPFDPDDYAPDDLRLVDVPYVYEPRLRDEAATAVEQMFAAFSDETGLEMQSQSAYRSYSTQVSTYDGWVSSLGQEGADLTSARPGHSEHQTGLAIDISALPAKCSLDQCFADTPQGEWLAENAWQYGFVLRFPEGLTDVTGYEFEPWHYRYVGPDLAAEYNASSARTLEEFFGLPAAPDYAD